MFVSSPPRLNSALLSAGVGSTSGPSSPVAGEEFATAASELAQGISRQQMLEFLVGKEWPLDQIQNFDDAVLLQLVNMVLSQANSSAEETLQPTLGTTQGAYLDGLLEDEFDRLSADVLNQSWYLDPRYWEGEVLPEAMPIPAMPFTEHYPDRDNHIDFLKARLLVWNVMHGQAVNAHAEGDLAYSLTGTQGEPLTGEDLCNEYNGLPAEVKSTLDQSCNVVFPSQVVDTQRKSKKWPEHEQYGPHMGFATFVMSKLLSAGQVQSFRALWYLAREFRLCAPGFKRRPHKGSSVDDAFSISRSGGGQQPKLLPIADELGVIISTPLTVHYSDFKGRFKPLRGKALNVVVKVEKDEQIQLTRCEDREIEGHTTPAIVHTPPESIPVVLGVLEFYYALLGFGQQSAGAGAASSDPKNDLFALFWWCAHGCLDGAGSAAKSDLCLRALHLALYKQPLAAWKPGFVPDIEAMLCEHTGAFLDKIKAEPFVNSD